MSRDPQPGGTPTFDPKDRVTLDRVKHEGDWHVVTGYVAGQKVSVDIPTSELRKRSEREGKALMRRSILGVSQMPRDERA